MFTHPFTINSIRILWHISTVAQTCLLWSRKRWLLSLGYACSPFCSPLLSFALLWTRQKVSGCLLALFRYSLYKQVNKKIFWNVFSLLILFMYLVLCIFQCWSNCPHTDNILDFSKWDYSDWEFAKGSDIKVEVDTLN